MIDLDPEVKRYLLRPLYRRPAKRLNPKAYLTALERLDQRARGEYDLQRLRKVISRLERKRSDWKNPDWVRERVALARALYASRRITRQQYVFYAVAPVEAIHEERILNDSYKHELGPIEEAIERIEREHGLQPDEYWLRNQGPREHVLLNRKYDKITQTKFRETLREFGLDDILAILVRSRDEFDDLRERGRRSVFHDSEYINAVRDIVLQHEAEAQKAAHVGAFSAAVTSLGAGLEGLLLIRCMRSPRKAASIAKTLPSRMRPRHPNDPGSWTFEALIETCLAAGWFRPIESAIAECRPALMAHALRHMRNSVHPGRQARERPWSVTDEQEYLDIEAIYLLLVSTLAQARSPRPDPSRRA